MEANLNHSYKLRRNVTTWNNYIYKRREWTFLNISIKKLIGKHCRIFIRMNIFECVPNWILPFYIFTIYQLSFSIKCYLLTLKCYFSLSMPTLQIFMSEKILYKCRRSKLTYHHYWLVKTRLKKKFQYLTRPQNYVETMITLLNLTEVLKLENTYLWAELLSIGIIFMRQL